MGALSVLTGIGNIGEQFGEAKDAVRKESEARSNKLREFTQSDAYLNLAKQQEQRQAEEFEFKKKSGDLIEMKDGRIWSVSQGKFIDQQKPDPMVMLNRFISQQRPESQKGLRERAQLEVENNPNDPKSAINAVLGYAKEQEAEANKRADAALAEHNKQADALTHHQEHEQDLSSAAADRREARQEAQAFQRSMVDYRLDEKAKQMTPVERKSYDSLKLMEPMVDGVIKFIEDHNLQNENDLIFGNRSALVQHLRQKGYAFGQMQDPITQKLFKDTGVLQVQGAAPFMTMGRSLKMYEDVKQHLPQQTDTPAQTYDKLTWMRDELFPDVKNSLSGYSVPGGGGQAAPAATAPDTGGPPPGAVIHDFSKE